MEDFFTGHGYLTLFMLSFLASTILPLGSEWLLAALVMNGHDPVLSVAVATVGNTLGACTTYGIGLYGGPFLIGRILRISDEAQQKAESLYTRYGSWSLLLSWVPIIGDPICLVGGILRIRLGRFFTLVVTGKLARYAIVSLIALGI
jgi:membrane protein YqaA with SNARE-associated domain